MKEVNLCEVPGISDRNRTEIPISPVVGTPPQDHGLRSKFRGNIVHRDLINEGGQSLRGARYFRSKSYRDSNLSRCRDATSGSWSAFQIPGKHCTPRLDQ